MFGCPSRALKPPRLGSRPASTPEAPAKIWRVVKLAAWGIFPKIFMLCILGWQCCGQEGTAMGWIVSRGASEGKPPQGPRASWCPAHKDQEARRGLEPDGRTGLRGTTVTVTEGKRWWQVELGEEENLDKSFDGLERGKPETQKVYKGKYSKGITCLVNKVCGK